MTSIALLDCTLRDGAYINDSYFGDNVIKGILNKLNSSNIEMVEVGWLKDNKREKNSSYFNKVEEIENFMPTEKNSNVQFLAMIDYGRYDINNLTHYNGKSIDAIRVVFPKEKFKEAIDFSKGIKEKGYKLCLQAANTQSYSDIELLELAQKVNEVMPESLSIVDTFGVMYSTDLSHKFLLLDNNLDKNIKIGFHSHNNLQLSFSLSMDFCELSRKSGRSVIIDSSLCGMGRGAGNTCTELITNYLNEKWQKNYDTNIIMDTIDVYMQTFIQNYSWGYSIPFCIAGQLGSHVNNIAYLQKTHKINHRDLKIVLSSLPKNERKLYNYDNLEKAYLNYINKEIDDSLSLKLLKKEFKNKDILLIAPGKTIQYEQDKIKTFIKQKSPIVIGINFIPDNYNCDYLFFSNIVRFNYAKEKSPITMSNTNKILTSNIKTNEENNEILINYNTLMRLGWKYFDNSTIMAIRLLTKIGTRSINIAGFDGYDIKEKNTYSDIILQSDLNLEEKMELNSNIQEMLIDILNRNKRKTALSFITSSQFENIFEKF